MHSVEFLLAYTENAEDDLKLLAADNGKKAVKKAVVKSLKLMSANLKHPSLHTHKYDEMEGPNGDEMEGPNGDEMEGPNGEDVFESYAQNNTPGAYRIFWHYGPGKKEITVLAITPHP